MTTCAAIYVRESPGHDLSGAEQEAMLRAFCARQGWTVSRVYKEQGVAREGRAVRQAMLSEAGARFDRIVTVSVCRLGASLPDLLAALALLRERGVSVTTAQPDGMEGAPVMDATMTLPVPALEAARRSWHRERVMAGKAKARARGILFGRPRVPEAKIEKVRAALEAGWGIRPTARAAGVGVATVVRVREQIATELRQDRAAARHSQAKLTDADIIQMRRVDHGMAAIARRFGITHGSALAAVSGMMWSHVVTPDFDAELYGAVAEAMQDSEDAADLLALLRARGYDLAAV